MVNVHYLDFELKIVGQDGRYVVQVLRSPAGEARCEFQRSLSGAELENLLLKLARVRSSTRVVDSPELAAARQLGAELFQATFRGTVRDCLRSSMAATQRDGQGLRLKLRLQDAPQLAVLPWEFLYDPDAGRFLARSAYTPIVRYVELPESIPAFPTAQPLRLLGIVASPHDYDSIEVGRERRLLEEALAPVVQAGQMEIRWLEKPTLAGLRRALRNGSYHILHFVGHGGFHDRTQQGVLVFEDERTQGALVDAETLGVLLHDHRSLRLAVLNACEGARSAADDPFAGVATTLVRQGIPAVVAMQFVITDRAARSFAEEFYAAVADGFPVDTAVAEARKAMLSAPSEVEWGTPVLFLRTGDGVLFEFQAKAPEQQDAGTNALIREEESAKALHPSTAHADQVAVSKESGLDVQNAGVFSPGDLDGPSNSAPQTGQIDESSERLLADLWRSALTAFYSRDWSAASRDFQAILEVDPTYKDAAAKLAKAQREPRLAHYYTEALKALNTGNLQEAADALQQLLSEDGAYKDAANVLRNVRTTMLMSAHYEDAQTLMNAGRWHAVLEVFDEISALNPDFSDPKQLQAAARAKIAEQNRRKELEDLLSKALEYIEAEEWEGAQLQLVRIQEIEPDFMGSAQLLLRAGEELTSSQREANDGQVQGVHDGSGLNDTASIYVTGPILLVQGDYSARTIAFSPDGKVIACGCFDKSVQLWDAATGAAIRTLKGHGEQVTTIAFSPDGKVIASGSLDSTIQLWDAATGVALRTIKGLDGLLCAMAFSPNGNIIAVGSLNFLSVNVPVRLWDQATGASIRTLEGHGMSVLAIAYSPDGKVIATGGYDKTIRLSDATTGESVRTLEGHKEAVWALAFSPDGKIIASGGYDKTVRLWDAATGNALRTFDGPGDGVLSVAFSPDGKVIASDGGPTVHLWNASTGEAFCTLNGHEHAIKSVAFSPDGKIIASYSRDSVQLWSVTSQ